MTLNIGDNAPDFTLKTKNAEGLQDITLSEHKDKQAVVLLFSHLHSQVYVPRKPVPSEMT